MEWKRQKLVELLELEGIVKTPQVKRALLSVPREEFVPVEYRDEAYEDHPLPIPEGQTISAPHMCAIMCEAAAIEKGDSVLEVGTGSGYHAALCAEIVSPTGEKIEGIVLTLEIIKCLASFALENLRRSGYYDRVNIVVADGSAGAPIRQGFRFKRIIVTAAAPATPSPLIEQLDEEGVMVIPVGSRWHQLLLSIKKKGGEVRTEPVTYCVFVALRGRYGYE
ncbi:MAG: protein-L-isoaspartate(D-aspartate) O-methyltransferase [Thermofilaceae archaeon]|nr:protein-L-isoaspartate(D-aspartate) O-methyltransferase [Thermofilaceae archaeon]